MHLKTKTKTKKEKAKKIEKKNSLNYKQPVQISLTFVNQTVCDKGTHLKKATWYKTRQ